MPRILGVDIPGNKKLPYALSYVYGIGSTRAQSVVKEAGLDPDRRAHELSEEELNKMVSVIAERQYLVEGDLRRDVAANIKRLQAIRSNRGIRHQRGLPVRGQRTSTNARTRKGGVKTVGVVRKK
jgi:small subunit ribosomal protein S13